MPTLLVSGAGVGDLSSFGTTSAVNTAQGIFAQGFEGQVSNPIVFASPAIGAQLNFDFTASYTPPSYVRLDFDPLRPITGVGLLIQTRMGDPIVANKAQGWTNDGWDSQAFGVGTHVTFDVPARLLNFDFTAAYTPPQAYNVGLYFDGKPLVAGVTLGLQGAFGATVLSTRYQLLPVGIPPPLFQNGPIVNRTGGLNFNFTASYSPPPGGMVRLDFDPLRPIPLLGFDVLSVGTPSVRNAAQGMTVSGFDSLRVGIPYAALRSFYSARIIFEFNDPYTPDTAHNIAFAFGDSKAAHGIGWDSLAFGSHIARIRLIAYPPGIDSLAVGPATKFTFSDVRELGWDSQIIGAQHVHFFFNYTRPDFIDSMEFGVPSVTQHIQAFYPFGWNSARYGVARLTNLITNPVLPLGFSDEAIGEPSLRLTRQIIRLIPGFDFMTFGLADVHSVIGPTQVILPEGADISVLGTPLLTFELQHVVLQYTVEQTQWGDAYIGYRVRPIFVPWSSFTQWGLPRINYNPKAFPFGFNVSALGVPRVAHANVRAVQGFDMLKMGVPVAKSMRRYVVVAPWPMRDGYGTPKVYNKRQYILVDNKQFFDYVPYMSNYNDVRNRNRQLYPIGIPEQKFSNIHRAHMPDQAVRPTGLAATQWGDHLVAYRIRRVLPKWLYAGFVDPYTFVHNYASILKGIGLDSLQIPTTHRIWFNAQTVAPRFIKVDAFGVPFVAPRVRRLTQAGGIGEFVAGTAWVSFYTRRVTEKAWVVPYGFGTPIVRKYTKQITPFPIVYNAYGMPVVRNKTPQLWPSMVDQAAYGRPDVGRVVRRVLPPSVPELLVPAPIVLFRNRYVYVPGILQLEVPMPTVRQEISESLTNQAVFPLGIEPPPGQVSSPTFYSNPFPVGWNSLQIGTVTVRLQGCYPVWDWPDSLFSFGTPMVNAVQHIYPTDVGEQTRWPEPYTRVSPHTIWCRFDTPAQAIENNPQSLLPWLGMDTGPFGTYPPPPWFGDARISTPTLQFLYPHHRGDSNGHDYTIGGWVDDNTLVLSTIRSIYPVGLKPTLFGFPKLNGPQSLRAGKVDSMAMGTPAIGSVPFSTQWIKPLGIAAPKFEDQYVDYFNRLVHPAGFSATEWGDNNPMVYHKPRGPRPVGADTSVFGSETWVSYLNREMPVEGFDSFEEGYTQGLFKDRMRVFGGGVYVPGYSAGDSLRMGVPSIRAPLQRIWPYMIPPPEYCHPHTVAEV